MAMMHLFILVIGVPSALIFAQGQVAVGNYGEETHIVFPAIDFLDPVYTYHCVKNSSMIYRRGVPDSTGKYTSKSTDGYFTLIITNTEVDDAGEYYCYMNTQDETIRLDIQAKGNVTAELSSSSGKLEVTFQKIYPSEISVNITCDSSHVDGSFVTNEIDGTLFTRKWESSTALSCKPSACSAEVTLRTTFIIHFDVISGAQTFCQEVAKLFTDLEKYFLIYHCTREAKGEFVKNDTCSDANYAKALIHLYTQDCEIPRGPFYSVLNREMRTNTTDELWQQSGKLINMAIDILNPEIYDVVFRGCSVNIEVPGKGETYSFNQITSTSLNRSVADNFCESGNGTSFTIKNAYGVSVEDFSAFPKEGEVLMKSTEKFTVERKDGNNITLVRRASQRKKRSPKYQSCITSDAGSTESYIQLRLLILFLFMFFDF